MEERQNNPLDVSVNPSSDLTVGSPVADDRVNSSANNGSPEVETTDDASGESIDLNPVSDVDESKDDDIQYRNPSSSCHVLSSSLTEALDICGLEEVPTDHSDSNLAVSLQAVDDTATSDCPLVTCSCGSGAASEVMPNDYVPKREFEDAGCGECSCDADDESNQTVPVLATHRAELAVELEKSDNSESADKESDDVNPNLSSDLETSDSGVIEAAPAADMETESADLPDSGAISVTSQESDCEPGSKASKLDAAPSTLDCSVGEDSETSDTGALHMSVRCQSTPENDRVVSCGDGDSDVSRDTSIGILMVCDDDGLVPSTNSELSDDVAYSEEEPNYRPLVYDHIQSSTEAGSENRALDVGAEVPHTSVENFATESSTAVTVEDVMLYEVDSRSQEMDELFADVSHTGVNTSHTSQLSEYSILSQEDGKHLLFLSGLNNSPRCICG